MPSKILQPSPPTLIAITPFSSGARPSNPSSFGSHCPAMAAVPSTNPHRTHSSSSHSEALRLRLVHPLMLGATLSYMMAGYTEYTVAYHYYNSMLKELIFSMNLHQWIHSCEGIDRKWLKCISSVDSCEVLL